MRRIVIGCVAVLVVLALATPPVQADWEAIDWLEGVDGYVEALQTAQETGRPVFVYFYTEWCGYCRQLERELLSDAVVQDELAKMLVVRVNPESGEAAGQLAARYSVRGFPALYVHPQSAWKSYAPLRRTVADAGRPRLKTPDEFVATLNAAIR